MTRNEPRAYPVVRARTAHCDTRLVSWLQPDLSPLGPDLSLGPDTGPVTKGLHRLNRRTDHCVLSPDMIHHPASEMLG